jgi:hypothetical protein
VCITYFSCISILFLCLCRRSQTSRQYRAKGHHAQCYPVSILIFIPATYVSLILVGFVCYPFSFSFQLHMCHFNLVGFVSYPFSFSFQLLYVSLILGFLCYPFSFLFQLHICVINTCRICLLSIRSFIPATYVSLTLVGFVCYPFSFSFQLLYVLSILSFIPATYMSF